MPISLGHRRPSFCPVSSRFIFMFALSQSPRTRLSRSLEQARLKGTRRIPDLYPTTRLTTRHHSLTITRHFDFLSPDRSSNNPRWRQSRNQSRCMHRCLQSSIIFYHHNGFPLRKFIVKLWRKWKCFVYLEVSGCCWQQPWQGPHFWI